MRISVRTRDSGKKADAMAMIDHTAVLGVLALQSAALGWGTHPEDLLPYFPPNGRLEVFEDSGHFVHIEQPRRVADLVLEFLS